MTKYRKKPVVIEAEQFFPESEHWPEGVVEKDDGSRNFTTVYWIDTLEGGHVVTPGDFIITGVSGEKYPCKPDIFYKTYEPADDAD